MFPTPPIAVGRGNVSLWESKMILLFQNGTRQGCKAGQVGISLPAVTGTLVLPVVSIPADSKRQRQTTPCRQQGVQTVRPESGRDRAVCKSFPVVKIECVVD